jgi:hypothetical protein
MRHVRFAILIVCLTGTGPSAQDAPRSTTANVASRDLASEVAGFLRQEITAHTADITSLNPPQPRVVGARTGGDFSFGSYMRAVMAYSALTGDRTVAGRDVPSFLGQVGLVDARGGGKTFAQLAGAMTLRHFGADLKTNPLWQSLAADEQALWRSLLDPARFYDRQTRKVINLPENYLGVAARIVAIDFQLGLVTDRAFVDDVLDRAAEQFTQGALYADDAVPSGRYDRYSQEYARFLYEAAEGVGRKDICRTLEPALNAVMRTWWGLVGPDGNGYPWGRTNGAISYMDTLEIVAFSAKYPQFRPAPLPQLASVYYAAWRWLKNDYRIDRHLLDIFAFGRGHFSYINPDREWQQTTAFFYKLAGAQQWLSAALEAERIEAFPDKPALPQVTRFDWHRRGDRPAGTWLVRQGALRFALPITTGTVPGIADYLPAPHGLPGFAAPVEQAVPAMTPYVELADGRVIVAGDGADAIEPAADGRSLRVTWQRWAVVRSESKTTGATPLVGGAGALVDPGLTAVVTWTLDGNAVVRRETITARTQTTIRRFSMMFTSTGGRVATSLREGGRRVDRFESPDGPVEVDVVASSVPLTVSLQATGNSAIGRGTRGAIPLVLEWQASDLVLPAGASLSWTLRLRAPGE